MKKFLKHLLLSLTFAGLAISTPAYAGQVEFVDGAGNFVITPSNDLFPSMKSMMPGDTATETITIRNSSSEYDHVNIHLLIDSTDDEGMGFLGSLTFQVSDQNGMLYQGPVSDAQGLELFLGSYKKDDTSEITFVIGVPSYLSEEFMKEVGEIEMTFKAEAFEDEEELHPLPIAPNTGLFSRIGAGGSVAVVGGATVAVCAVVILFVRRKKLLKK